MKRNLILDLSGKIVCPLLLLTFILAGSAFAQTAKMVVEIRAEVASINKGTAKYKKTKKDVEGISLEGTEATFYRSGENLRKITAKMFGESVYADGEFYYRDGHLIFALLKRTMYSDALGSSRKRRVTSVEEQRYYFENDNLIRLLIGTKELNSKNQRYTQLNNELISTANQLRAALESGVKPSDASRP